MAKNCPHCGARFEYDSQFKFCPYCCHELSSESTKRIDDNLDDDLSMNDSGYKKKGIIDTYLDYEAKRAHLGMYLYLISGVLILIVSIIGAFFNLYFLFGLIFAALSFGAAFVDYVIQL